MLHNPAVDIGLLDLEVGVIHWMDGIFHLDNVVDVNRGWGSLGPVGIGHGLDFECGNQR